MDSSTLAKLKLLFIFELIFESKQLQTTYQMFVKSSQNKVQVKKQIAWVHENRQKFVNIKCQSILLQMIPILLSLLIIVQIHSTCLKPQKLIFLSLRSLAGRQHMQRMFDKMSQQVADYSLAYTESRTNKHYQINNFSYRFRYNSHYQKQSFVSQKIVRVLLGRIDLLAEMNYLIKDSQGYTIYQGTQHATSTIDPSYFSKQLIQKGDYIQWQVFNSDLVSFNSLWIMEGNFRLPEAEKYVLQKMINYIVPTLQLNRIISEQINTLFKSYLRPFLNSDHIFTTNQIAYRFRNISLPLIHRVRSMSVSNATQGLIALIDFEVSDVQQTKCNEIPEYFSQKNYGGIQEVISISTISFMILQAIKRGLFNVNLDRSWQSQVFQFYMGDLANAASQAEIQEATSSISISCKPSNISKVISSQFDQSTLYIQLPQQCLIQHNNQPIIKVEMYLIVLAKFIPEREHLSVRVNKAYSRSTKYISLNPKFVITNSEVAKMIQHSLLQKMNGIPVFGTNLPLIEKKSPALILLPDYLIVFDVSQLLPTMKLGSNQILSQ